MTPEEWRRNEANRWLAVAGKDLHAARLLAKEEPWAAVFHCQQAAEKSAKAFLALHEVAFRRTHDLNELGKQCVALEAGLARLLEDAAGLTDYAVVFRYLDAPHEPDEAEAESALTIAQRLYDRVRGLVGPDESVETKGDHK
jgi:HEPN domain-containing protein